MPTDPKDIDALRRKAEKLLLEAPEKLDLMSGADVQGLVHSFSVYQIELEMQNEELLRSREQLEESRSEYADLYDFAPFGYLTFDKRGHVTRANLTACGLLGIERGRLGKKPFTLFVHPESQDIFYFHKQKVFETTTAQTCQLVVRRKDGTFFDAQLESIAVQVNGQPAVNTVVTDITDRKRAETEREMAVGFLRLINEIRTKSDMIYAAVAFFQAHSGCEAVGIRLKEGDDYPYHEARGFPMEFVQAENRLCSQDAAGLPVRDSAGYPIMECMCGNVIQGRFDPSKPFFSPHGSFWSNCTTELLATSTEEDRQARTRNRCNGEGYESVALIALRVGEDRLGLLQLNDRRKGRFSPETIALWERLAGYLAVALAKFGAEEALRQGEEHYRSLFDNMLNGFAFCRMIFDGDVPKDFVYLSVNAAFEALTGLKNVTGKRVSQVIPGIRESDPGLFEVYGRVASTGTPERFETYVGALDMWFAIAVYSPRREHFVAVFDVITERKKAEAGLRESEERYRVAVESSSDAVALIRGGRHIYVNRKFLDIFGYDTPEEIIGKPFLNTVHPDDRKIVKKYSRRGERGEEAPDRYEFRGVTKSGTTKHIEASVARVVYRGKPGGLAYLRDVTERKRAEEALRDSLEEKVVLLKEVHHRVKNNLQIVESLLSLQASDSQDRA